MVAVEAPVRRIFCLLATDLTKMAAVEGFSKLNMYYTDDFGKTQVLLIRAPV